MLGPTNMGEMSVVFGDLVRLLKDLPPGGFDKAYAARPPAASATTPHSFRCDKQLFKDVVRLAELGERLASAAHKPTEVPQDPFIETVLAGMRSLEAKVDQLALDTANISAKQAVPPKTFAEATSKGKSSEAQHGKPSAGAKGKKKPSAPRPARAPQLTLSQLSTERDDFVEISTDAGLLALRAKEALTSALRKQSPDGADQTPSVMLRGITRNAFTGEIQLHLGSQDSLKAILALKSDEWVSSVNPGLGLKRKVFPIIVHGVPTSFKPDVQHHIKKFFAENHGVLDTATKIVWANRHSIESGKPFSSLIIHLTDPMAANQAIRDQVCFGHMLKVTEKSTKRIKQCYTCLDFGHYAKSCSESIRACSHCAGGHHYSACTKKDSPIRCVNCTHHILDEEFASDPTATIKDMSDAQTARCRHSAFSNQCPLRRAQVAKNAHMSDYYKDHSHE